MFYEVRVLNPQGEIQKVFSADQLSRRYWKRFMEEENNKRQREKEEKEKGQLRKTEGESMLS